VVPCYELLVRSAIDKNNYKVYSAKDFPAYLPKLNQLYDDLFTGGKGFRSYLVNEVASHLKLNAKTIHLLSQTIEFIHNASLLHDDLIDEALLRRGKTAAWKKYSTDYAVLAGDYLLARVMVNLSEHGNVQLIHYTAQMISDLVEGEWLQDSIIGDYFVSVDQLDRIHNYKTASLFKWCLKAPFIAAEEKNSEMIQTLEEMGTILGVLFQRSDDLLDYDIRNTEGKLILGDLLSGYLNSFGAFITFHLQKEQIDLLIKSKELSEFVNHLGGPEKMASYLREFDDQNAKLIQLYHHHLGELAEKLKPEHQGMIEALKPLADLLYWRKQKPAELSSNG
jgi:octaprenyl-diphosphate synthase